MLNKSYHSGLTVLELLVALAIIGIVATAAPNFWTWVKSYGYKNSYHQLQDSLSSLRNEALSKNTTARLVIEKSGDVYTLRSYVSSVPVANCSVSGSWTQLPDEILNVPGAFQITGAAMTNLCFYRDGSASGGTYTITQKDGGTDIGRAVITISMATGYMDVQAH